MVKGNAKILNIVKFFATILLVIAMAIVMVLQSITNNYAKVSSKHQYTSNISNATEVELETVEDLSVEVIPQRGVNILESNDVVYEGEYIKYNIKVTNNTEQEMNNINIIGEIPDGVKLAELYYNFDEIRQPYGYTFSDEKQINIEIDSLEAGKTKELFYEVKVCDLEDDIESLQITSIINTYLNNEIKNTFELENEIKPAEVKLFLGSYVENGARTYVLNLASEIQSQVEVNFYLPQEYSVTTICMVDISDFDVTKAYNGGGRYVYIEGEDNQNTDYTLDISISEENVLTTTLESNHTYKFVGPMDSLQIERDADEIEKTITAYVETADGKYVSNENRMNIYLQSVEVTMSSPNERSLLKYQEELEYDVEIKNIGSDLIEYREINNYVVVNVSDFLPDEINANEIIYDNWKILYDEINVDDEVVIKEV